MTAIVDVQGFKNEENTFIVKEIAIICNNQLQVFLIKPPYPFYNLTKTERKLVHWIERNRKICWNDGFLPYYDYKFHVVKYLEGKRIYTKGSEKVLWLRDILQTNDVHNLEDKGCPKLFSLYEKYNLSTDVFNCAYHPTVCALKNVTCIRKWCLDNKVFLN